MHDMKPRLREMNNLFKVKKITAPALIPLPASTPVDEGINVIRS